MITWLKRLIRGHWVVVETRWPYPEGYGTYCPRRKILLDAGLTREQARYACHALNRRAA